MARRLISSTKSEMRSLTAAELKASIRASEGRVVLVQNAVLYAPLVSGATNPEMSEAMGGDMVFFNTYSMDASIPVPGLQLQVFENGSYVDKSCRLKDMKRFCRGPLGIYLECGKADDASTATSLSRKIRPDRIASDENLRKLLDEEADFVVLAGNPGTGTIIENIVDATRRAKQILGDKILIFAGKWEDGVYDKVLGDPLAARPANDVVRELIDAGADVICLPMPGSRTGITVEMIRKIVEFAHAYKEGTLCMSFLDGSIEGADEATVRECALMSKQTGADIHCIGDAGLHGMPAPENIYQMAITTKGRRLTWLKIGGGHR